MACIQDRHWSCDICGDKVTTPHTQQPAGWLGVTIHPSPEHADGSKRLHVCERCTFSPPRGPATERGFGALVAATGGRYS